MIKFDQQGVTKNLLTANAQDGHKADRLHSC